MAELVVSEGNRMSLRPEGTVVGRHSEDGSFRPDVDLAGLEGGRTVSRQHARIYRREGQWYLRVEPTTVNPTVVAGRPLVASQEASLSDGDEVVLGRVVAVFRIGEELAPVEPEPPRPAWVETTAELRGEDRLFPLGAPEGRALTLGRHSEDGTYKPDVDLADLPYGRTVSRRHGHLIYRDEQWFLRVEAEVTNPTLLDGRTLAKGEEVLLNDGNRLQMGRVVVTFHQLKKIASVGPEQIDLIVEPAQITVKPGGQAEATITVINHTGHVDWFRVEVEGLPEAWYRIVLPDGTVGSPAQVRLFHTAAHATPAPDSVARLKIVIAPPKDSESRAGRHPLVFLATTQGEPQMRRVTTGHLFVERFEHLVVSLEPEDIPKTQGEYRLALHNAGNDQVTVDLNIEGKWLAFQSDRQQVEIVNGGRDLIRIKAKSQKRHWLGGPRLYTFAVKAKAGGEEVTQRARLTCPPRVPLWMQTAYRRVHSFLFPLLFIIAVLGIAFAFARPADIKDFKAEPATLAAGSEVVLSWTTERATGLTIEPAAGTEDLTLGKGTLKVSPAVNTKYTLTARNRVGLTTSRTLNVEVKPLPQILVFTATPERIKKEGDTVTLRWETNEATKVVIEPADEVEDPKASGEVTVRPTQNNATYKLIATNDAGSREAIKTVAIEPPQVATFMASPETVTQGGTVRLRWSAQGHTKTTIKASTGEVVPGQTELEVPAGATDQVVRPLEDTEYTLTATNAGGSDSKTVKVSVSPMTIAFFKVEPPSIAKGESAMLTWSVEGATSITIQPGVGAVAPGQTSALVKPTDDTEYTLTATSADDKQVQAKAKVMVGLGPVKIDFFAAAPAVINAGEQATLSYSAQNAKRVVIQASDGAIIADSAVSQPSVRGSVVVSPQKTTIYTITISNDSGQTALPATVEVRPASP